MGIADLVNDWGGFERLVADLHDTGEVTVERNVTLTGQSGAPRQIDVLIRHKQGLYEHLVVAECKYWNSPVERQDVNALGATVTDVGASRGVIFTTKGFQSGAVAQAKHDHIELFVVRDLSDVEWGLPGRVVDLFLQIVQMGVGHIQTYDTYKIGNPFNATQVTFNLEFGLDGPISCTPTLKRDGSPGGDPMEQHILQCAKQALTKSLGEVHMFNGGEECTRYVLAPINVLPDVPFKIPLNGELFVIPRMTFDLGIKFVQSRITVDRAKRYPCALRGPVHT